MTEIRDVLAARNLILQRNAALRVVGQAEPEGRNDSEAFAAKLVNALQSSSALSSVDTSAQQPKAGNAIGSVLAKVNAGMEQEDVATEAFERGETTDIASVVLMQQRASIQFEATLQIRNKLLSAYKDIMNMPLG